MRGPQERINSELVAHGSPSARHRQLSSWLPDTLGVLWVLGAGLAMLVPALVHGSHLGPFDLLSKFALSKAPGVVVHNHYPTDQIRAIIPWTTLSWMQVHQGHLPLWNPYAALGMPLAFNWQSASFGLPAMVGYLVPVQYAYTVGIATTVIVAGTGAYFLGRVLHLGVLACAMAGTVFELSGPFVTWLGWPHGAVMSWSGWLFASALLVMRGRNRARDIAFLAVVLALAVYAGQPETLVLLILALVLFIAVVLIPLAWRLEPSSLLRPVVDLGMASIAGLALAAPMLLPGTQLAALSVHTKKAALSPLPVRDLAYLISQGFDGLPVAGSREFGWLQTNLYVGAYVGVIALVLASAGVFYRRRRPQVVAFVALIVVFGLVAFASIDRSLASLVSKVPIVGIFPSRALFPMGFAIAILAGVGVDTLVGADRKREWRWVGAGFAVAGVAVALSYFDSVGNLPTVEHQIRIRSLIWPMVSVLAGLVAVGGSLLLLRRHRVQPDLAPELNRPDSDGRSHPDGPLDFDGQYEGPSIGNMSAWSRLGASRLSAVLLLVVETAFLVSASAPLWSSSSTFYAPTPAEQALRRAVGSSIVGMGQTTVRCTGLGILPNVNDVYGVAEFAVLDPILPKSYFDSYVQQTGRSAGTHLANNYCPAFRSASVASFYGVSFILEPKGTSGPPGTTFVAHVGDEDLYHVPKSYPATLTPLLAGGKAPSDSAVGTPVRVTHPDPATWRLTAAASAPQVLRLRLANVPGWHASIDGVPLKLEGFSGIMLQANIPSGHHLIEVHYWPESFTIGLVLAACSLIGLTAFVVVSAKRRSRPNRNSPSPSSTPPQEPG